MLNSVHRIEFVSLAATESPKHQLISFELKHLHVFTEGDPVFDF